MRIAVDVMGGDYGPGTVIDGVELALADNAKISLVYLVGRQNEIKACLSRSRCRDPRIELVHASDVLTMDDKPVEALRKKKDSSIIRAVDLVKSGNADAVVSCGNTGGVVAAATIRLRPVPGLERAAIATVIPGPENDFVLLDSGGSVECRPMHLLHFAIMGHVYARELLNKPKPRVAILSNGLEASKGNALTQEASRLCQQADINFTGYVEGHGLFHNQVDVVVCDGFVGNIVLKTIESFANGLAGWLKLELGKGSKRMPGTMQAEKALRTIQRRMDPEGCGGAALLGLNGHVTKAHGSARARAIMNALRFTADAVQHHLQQAVQTEIAQTNLKIAGVVGLSHPA